jgi:phage tail sheath protein FI
MANRYTTPGVYIEEISFTNAQVAQVETAIPAFFGFTLRLPEAHRYKPVKCSSFLEFLEKFANPLTPQSTSPEAQEPQQTLSFQLYQQIKMFSDNGGGTFFVISLGTYEQYQPDDIPAQLNLALDALRTEPADLLLFPDAANFPAPIYKHVFQSLLAFAADLPKRFVLLDIPENGNNDNVSPFRNALGNKHLNFGAAYYPMLKTPSGQTLYPSGALAGIYAQTTQTSGVWKAPANVSINSVLGVSKALNRIDIHGLTQDPQHGKSINPILQISGKGITVMGARTLAGNDNEWRFIPVRLLFNMVENSLRHFLVPWRTQPNDKNTHVRILQATDQFFTQLWRSGAFQGPKPESAWYCRLGLGETMSPQDLQEGNLILEYGLAIIRPSEFITNRIQIQMNIKPKQNEPQQISKATHSKQTTIFPLQPLHTPEIWAQPSRPALQNPVLLKSLQMAAPTRILLFGKTTGERKLLIAHAGNRLGRPVYVLDGETLRNHYIGETEKNLVRMLDQAQTNRWILFFDEADALFGKRTLLKTNNTLDQTTLLNHLKQYAGTLVLSMAFKKDCPPDVLRIMTTVVRI